MSDSKSKTASARERQLRFTTLSGLPVERLYTPESLEGWNADEALGYPGEFPYTRGIYPTMYRGRFWTGNTSLDQSTTWPAGTWASTSGSIT